MKAGLTIGVYLDQNGQLPTMAAVRQATQGSEQGVSPYLQLDGDSGFCAAAQALILGADSPAIAERRVVTIQTPGGSGALRLGADVLRGGLNHSAIWVSDPTWDNHFALFKGAGLQVHTYPYYDRQTGGLDLSGMLTTLAQIPPGSAVLLHACCHNPTGIDPTPDEWEQILQVIVARDLVPFVDMAYQGFGEGLDEDAWLIRTLVQRNHEFLIAQSFSKNFSLYGERIGSLTLVAREQHAAEKARGEVLRHVRNSYSTPPTYGARIVAQVLNSPALSALWSSEVQGMRQRIRDMRQRLHAHLKQQLGDQHDVDYILRHRGMFTYTGLSPEQVDHLREVSGVYLVRSGRLCVSGLTQNNVPHVASAIAAVLQQG
jgi:aromatic-amino-acid transaminase